MFLKIPLLATCSTVMASSGPSWPHLGPALAPLGAHLGALLGHIGVTLGTPGPPGGHIGAVLAHLGAALGLSCGPLASPWNFLGQLSPTLDQLGAPGRSPNPFWKPSLAHSGPIFGPSWGHLGTLLGPTLARMDNRGALLRYLNSTFYLSFSLLTLHSHLASLAYLSV